MIKSYIKNWGAGLISAVTIGGIAWACAGGDWNDYGTSSFTPEAFVEKKYSPFFYAPDITYYGIQHDNEQVDRFHDKNIMDWTAYLNSKADLAEMAYLLDTCSKGLVDSAGKALNGDAAYLPEKIASFQLFKTADPARLKNFISYLSLAKEAAVFATNTYNWWDAETHASKLYENAPTLNQQLLDGFEKSTDKFLQQRYWFQLVRSYFFNNDAKKSETFFEQYASRFEHNIMYYRTLSYAAGACWLQKNFSKANYYYSLVFENCDELKTTAHYSFHPQNENDWKATLAMCKNKEEQITLWQMLGIFYADEKRSISEIYKLNPASKKLNLLLSRAVNKAEQPSSQEYGVAKLPAKNTAGKALLDQVSFIAIKGNTNDPFMWNAAAGYISMLSGNYKKAQAFYAAADKYTVTDTLKQWQLRLLKVLNKVEGAVKIDDKMEADVLKDIEWLHAMYGDESAPFRHADAFEVIKNTMAKKYRKQLEPVKAECFVSNASFYLNNKNVETLKALLEKSSPAPYESLCRTMYVNNVESIYEFQAIKMAFEDKVDEAIVLMGKAPTAAAVYLQGNPFNARIIDCNDCDHQTYKGTLYTKMSLLKKIKEMEQNIAAGKDVYSNAVLLGSVFYNMSHYGNGRAFYENAIYGSYQYSPWAIDNSFRTMLTSMKQSVKYWQKALAVASTREQKARCVYLLAKCQRNEWYNKNVYTKEEYYYNENGLDLRSMSYFGTLKTYSDTRYYQEVIKECGYFRDYIKKY